MPTLRRFTLSDQLVEALRADILAGRWPDPLPGCRKLGEVYGVSGPTIVTALSRLAEMGILRAGGSRRAFRLAKPLAPSSRIPAPVRKSSQRIVLVGSRALEDLDAWDRNLIHALNRALAPQGAGALYLRVDFDGQQSAPRRWSVALSQQQPDLVVPLTPTPAFLSWLAQSGFNVVSLGGRVRPGHPPIFGPNLTTIVLRARSLLTELGHRRIVFAAFHLSQSQYRQRLRDNIARSLGLTRRQLDAEAFLACDHLASADESHRRLREILAERRPTALILAEWREYLLAFSLATALGLRVPQDLSLVVLSASPDLDFMVPRPAHLVIPHEIYVDLLVRRLRGEKVDPEDFSRRCEEHWDRGGTLAPPAASD